MNIFKVWQRTKHENKVGIDEWNILKSVRTYLAAFGTRWTLRRENNVRIKQKHFHHSPNLNINKTHWFPIQSKWTLEKKADPIITLNMTNTKAATNLMFGKLHVYFCYIRPSSISFSFTSMGAVFSYNSWLCINSFIYCLLKNPQENSEKKLWRKEWS